MKLQFLGTGAADWCLALHKGCDGFRRNSALLIDDCLLVDPSPDVPDAIGEFNIDKTQIKYIINSHKHPDHYNEDTVRYLSGAELIELAAGEIKQIGKYTVQALRANHSTETVHFIIFDGEKRLFYGLDGGWLMFEEIEAIKENGIDLIIFDATVGDIPGDYRIFEHNNLSMVREMKTSLEPHIKRFMISHMARTLHTSHGELCENMKKHGIEVAFDGMETEV